MRSFSELEALTDHRRSERVVARVPVRFGITSLEHSAIAQNVSVTGLFICTNEVYRVGTTLRLAIELADDVVRLGGSVTWAIKAPPHMCDALEHGMGVQYIDPPRAWPALFRAWRESTHADLPSSF